MPIPPTACGVTEHIPSRGAAHVAEPAPISYDDVPPSSGDHRPQWAKWGEYSTLPPETWLHNLEHGGAALLYQPGDPDGMAAKLRSYAMARRSDDGGPFRYVLAPYQGLQERVGVVTWTWTYLATDVCQAEISAFLDEHYRQAPEDVAGDGAFEDGWIGR